MVFPGQDDSLYEHLYGVVGAINTLIGNNHLFIAHKPETASLIDDLGPWPWYILVLEGVGLVLFTLLYVPFALNDFSRRRRAVHARAG